MPLKTDFLKKLKEVATTKKQPIERAFIHWYIGVTFGDPDYIVTDGPYDGGIDAVVRPKRVAGNKLVYIIQAKYTEGFFFKKTSAPLIPAHYTEFDNLYSIFDSDSKFNKWITSVDNSLKKDYALLRKDFLNQNNIIEWRLITLNSRSRKGENRLQNIGVDSFQYGSSLLELYELEREGATPPGDPLELNFSESMTFEDPRQGYKSYILAAELDNFINYLDHDPDRKLFARNVRLDLRSDINVDIKNTYVKSPSEFWYSHNGVSVVCSNATITGKCIRLINPSVINGSQTLNTLYGISKNNRGKKATVLTRVLVVTGGDREKSTSSASKKFVNDIIFRTNQQNKMYAYDLRANDVFQVSLAKDFMKNKVFYERRRGEWSQQRRTFRNEGIGKISSIELAQILAASNPSIGVAIAKKGKEVLFRELYDTIFYDSSFEEKYLIFKLFRFTAHTIREMSYYTTTPRMRKHAYLTVASISYNVIKKSKDYKNLLNSMHIINNIDTDNLKCGKINKVIRKIFKGCWSKWGKENKKDRTLSPNNFFKSEKWNSWLREDLVKKHLHAGNAAVQYIRR